MGSKSRKQHKFSLNWGLILISCSGIIISYVFLFSRHYRTSSEPHTKYYTAIVWLVLAGCIHPATIDLYLLSGRHDGEPFWKYYQKPRIINAIAKPKNFIFIYAESLERTYFNQDIFPGLIKELKHIEENSISFTNIGHYPETGWTIAGMVASQCGLPLVALSEGNSMAGMDTFLSGATCMGDLLSQQGYYLAYLGGASLEFAGKGKFFRSHGFDEILGLEELLPYLSDKSYKHSWGLYDDSLFDIAFRKFESLSRREEPFGIFLLTLDTHGWENNFSKSCKGMVYASGKNGMLNAISCSDLLISKFINRVRSSNYFENTIIVLASDHLAMRNKSSKMLKKNKDKRKNLFMIIDSQNNSGSMVDKKGSTLDTGPTVLGAVGFEAQLGLGRDLLKEVPSVAGEIKNLKKTSSGWRREIVKFWSFPKIKNNIVINGNKRKIYIDGREFSTPILVKYDDNLETKLWFQLYNDASFHKTLLQHLEKFDADDSFLLVDNCAVLKSKWKDMSGKGLCYVNGKPGSAEIIKKSISGEKILTASELKSPGKEPKGTR